VHQPVIAREQRSSGSKTSVLMFLLSSVPYDTIFIQILGKKS
jgi:hypothetical protein